VGCSWEHRGVFTPVPGVTVLLPAADRTAQGDLFGGAPPGHIFTGSLYDAHRQHLAVRRRGDRYPSASRDELGAPHKKNDEHDDQNDDEGADSDVHVS
jgi:hypothetical protein